MHESDNELKIDLDLIKYLSRHGSCFCILFLNRIPLPVSMRTVVQGYVICFYLLVPLSIHCFFVFGTSANVALSDVHWLAILLLNLMLLQRHAQSWKVQGNFYAHPLFD